MRGKIAFLKIGMKIPKIIQLERIGVWVGELFISFLLFFKKISCGLFLVEIFSHIMRG